MLVAPVCRVGDQLNLTCTASIEFITWSVFCVNEQGILERAINDEPINSEDMLQMPEPTVNSLATFTFMRTSAQGDLPLISTLSVDSVHEHWFEWNSSVLYGWKKQGRKQVDVSFNYHPNY